MQLTKKNAIVLFTELGFASCEKWDCSKFTTKINQLADKIDPEQEMETPAGQKVLEQVFEALEAGTKIEVVDAAETPAKGKKAPAAPAPKKGKKAPALVEEDEEVEEEDVEEDAPAPAPKKGKGKGKKAPAPVEEEEEEEEAPAPKKGKKPAAPATSKGKKPAAETDKLGNRVGSQAAQINAVLTKKLQTVEALAEACELPAARVRGHVQYLMKKELVEHVDGKGYRLK